MNFSSETSNISEDIIFPMPLNEFLKQKKKTKTKTRKNAVMDDKTYNMCIEHQKQLDKQNLDDQEMEISKPRNQTVNIKQKNQTKNSRKNKTKISPIEKTSKNALIVIDFNTKLYIINFKENESLMTVMSRISSKIGHQMLGTHNKFLYNIKINNRTILASKATNTLEELGFNPIGAPDSFLCITLQNKEGTLL